jgi:hypothetical protein
MVRPVVVIVVVGGVVVARGRVVVVARVAAVDVGAAVVVTVSDVALVGVPPAAPTRIPRCCGDEPRATTINAPAVSTASITKTARRTIGSVGSGARS